MFVGFCWHNHNGKKLFYQPALYSVLWAPWIKSLKTPSQFQDCCLIAASLHILNLQKLKIFLWWLTWRRSGRTEMLSVNDNNVVLNLANFYLQDTKMTFMLPGERKDLNDGIFIFPTPLQSIKHKHKCCGELYNNPEGVLCLLLI